jgi:hypothetical protein
MIFRSARASSAAAARKWHLTNLPFGVLADLVAKTVHNLEIELQITKSGSRSSAPSISCGEQRAIPAESAIRARFVRAPFEALMVAMIRAQDLQRYDTDRKIRARGGTCSMQPARLATGRARQNNCAKSEN